MTLTEKEFNTKEELFNYIRESEESIQVVKIKNRLHSYILFYLNI